MKQITGSKNCVAIVACMATGCKPYDVDVFLNKNTSEEGITDLEFYKFMMHKGYVIGIGIEGLWSEGLNIPNGKAILSLKYRVNKHPAYLIVQSETNPEYAHAIYWDGDKIWDPNPSAKDGRDIGEYEIFRFFPIIRAVDKTPENNEEQFIIESAEIPISEKLKHIEKG